MNSEVFAEFSRELLNEKDVYFDARGTGYTRRIMRDMPIHEHTVTFPGETDLMLDNGQKVTVTDLTVTGRDDEHVRTATVSPGHAPVIVGIDVPPANAVYVLDTGGKLRPVGLLDPEQDAGDTTVKWGDVKKSGDLTDTISVTITETDDATLRMYFGDKYADNVISRRDEARKIRHTRDSIDKNIRGFFNARSEESAAFQQRMDDLAARARKAQANIGRLNDKLNHDDHKNHVHFKVGGILRDEPVVKAYTEYTPGAFPAGDSATLDTEGNITVTNTTGDVQAQHCYYGSSAAPLTVYVSSYGTLTVRNHYGHRIGFYAAGTWHTLTVY